MFQRLFSSSPKRPPPPDPTPKWKEEVAKIDTNAASLKSAFPTVPLSSVAAAGSSSPTSQAHSPNSSSENNHQQTFDAIPKLMFVLENDSGEGFARRVKPLAFAVCKQYEEVKKAVTDTIAPKLQENSKNLREQLESIATAFSDAHELKYTREDLENANKKNEGLQNEIETVRQTVMELMGKIAKLNPKAAKELKEQQQQSSPSKSPEASSPSPSRPTAARELRDSNSQVSFPMILNNDDEATAALKLLPEDELRRKLADTQFLLQEATSALNERTNKGASSDNNNNNSAAAKRVKSLEAQIVEMQQKHEQVLADKKKLWEQQMTETTKKALAQKEECVRSRIENDEMESRNIYLVQEYISMHVGDARVKLAIAEKEAKQAKDENYESQQRVRDLEVDKERLTKDLTENTRAMMLLQASTSNEPSPMKSPSPSKSKFGF